MVAEQLGSLHKAGSRKMTDINTTTAGIDTSKLKLDIAGLASTESRQCVVPSPRPTDLARIDVLQFGLQKLQRLKLCKQRVKRTAANVDTRG